jgi:hypothetical protein
VRSAHFATRPYPHTASNRPLTPYPRIIVAPQVRHILDSTVASLLANPARKFVYVEQAFFQRWYAEQDAASAAVVAQLVAEGRLSFLNGGWSMHDEATTVYSDMVDNTQVRGGLRGGCDSDAAYGPLVALRNLGISLTIRHDTQHPPYYMQLGHRYMATQFGSEAIPSVTWQVRWAAVRRKRPQLPPLRG